MKKVFIIILISLLAKNSYSQTVLITNNCTKNINTAGDIILDQNGPGPIVLNNVTINCNTLIINNNVTGIQIGGKVIINCKSVNIITVAAPIVISGAGTKFTIDCPSATFSLNRSFSLQTGSSVELQLSKAP